MADTQWLNRIFAEYREPMERIAKSNGGRQRFRDALSEKLDDQ